MRAEASPPCQRQAFRIFILELPKGVLGQTLRELLQTWLAQQGWSCPSLPKIVPILALKVLHPWNPLRSEQIKMIGHLRHDPSVLTSAKAGPREGSCIRRLSLSEEVFLEHGDVGLFVGCRDLLGQGDEKQNPPYFFQLPSEHLATNKSGMKESATPKL